MFSGDERHLRFSIRKFAVGVASIAIGAYFLVSPFESTILAEQLTERLQTEGQVRVIYAGVKESDLTNLEQTLVKHEPLSQTKADEEGTYVLVYAPKTSQVLPKTGDASFSLVSLLTLASTPFILLVIKDRKKKLATVVVLTTLLAGSVAFAQTIQPLFQKAFHLSAGQALSEVSVDGYNYVGYIDVANLPADSALHALFAENGLSTVSSMDETVEKSGPEMTEASETTVVTEVVEEKDGDKSEASSPIVSISTTAISGDLPASEVPEVSSVPGKYPTVDVPVMEEVVSAEVPVAYPTVTLPEAEMPEVSSVPTTYPTVDVPVMEEVVSAEVPVAYPTVDLPVVEVPAVNSVPETYPTVEVPVMEDVVSAEVPVTYPTVTLPEAEMPEVSSVPTTYPTVEVPVMAEAVSAEVPVTYPTVDLPVVEVPAVNSVPESYPTVEVPVMAEVVSVEVPETYPTVDLPEAEIPEVSSVPTTYPTVEVPVMAEVVSAEVPVTYPTVDLPEAEMPEVSSVPTTYPTVEVPVMAEVVSAEVPVTYPTVDLPEAEIPEVSSVPTTYPTVEVPVMEEVVSAEVPVTYPTVDLPEAEIPEVSSVPTTYPTLELPVMAEVVSVEVPSTSPTLTLATVEMVENVVLEDLPYSEDRVESDRLYVGETERVEGENGQRRHVYRRFLVNGEEVGLEEIEDSLLKAPVNALVTVGIRQPDVSIPDNSPLVSRETADILPLAEHVLTLTNRIEERLATVVDLADKTEDSVGTYNNTKVTVEEDLKRLKADFDSPNLTVASLQTMLDSLNQYLTTYENAVEQLKDKPLEDVELTEKKLEFKDVEEAYLYRLSGDKQMVKVLHLEKQPSQTEDLFIKVDLANAKNVWLKVKQVTEADGHYLVTGQMPKLVQFTDTNTVADNYTIKVAKQVAQPNVYTSFKALIEAIQKNPAGDFVIGSDLTATELPKAVNESSYLDGVTFMGTLKSEDNKRYTIYDLGKSLFQNLYHATVSNINLSKVDVKVTQAENIGALAQSAENSEISNISASGSVAGRVLAAGLLGVADNNTRVTNSSFVGRVSSGQSAAGLVGRVTRGSHVDKSFADVEMAASLTSSNRLGGLVAEINENASLTNSYVKGHIANYGEGDASVGGAVGAVYGVAESQDSGRIENVTSYVKVVNGHDFVGNVKYLTPREKTLTNNAVVNDLATGWHVDKDGLTRLDKSQADAKIASTYVQPRHTHETLTNASKVDYRKVKGYQDDYAKAYENLAKFLPFYDRQTVVKEANKLASSENLVQKTVESLVPYIDGKIASRFYTNKSNINKLLVRYTDGSKEWLDLSQPSDFADTGIVDYTTNKGISYHPHQLVKDNSKLLDSIMSLVDGKEFDYTIFNPANLAEWVEQDRTKRLEKLYLRDSFALAKPKMRQILAGLLDNTAVGDYTEGALHDYMTKRLTDNVNALLVGSTYMERWYNFSEVLDNLIYGMGTYNSEADSLDLVTELGNESIDTLKSFATQATYAQTLSKYTGISNVLDFVKKNYNLYKADNVDTIDDWIKQTSKAYIVTRDSKSRPQQKGVIFDRMAIPEFQYMLLPLLNIREEHVYAIFSSNSTSFGIYDAYMNTDKASRDYQKNRDKVRSDVNKTADAIQRYFDVLYRLLKPEFVERLTKTNLQVFDTLSGYNGWSDEYGSGAFESVKAFAAPIARWQEESRAAAYAPVAWNTELVHFAKRKLLTEEGWSTLTHEHMHNLDDKVILAGYGKRFGHGAESYARGLFQSPGTVSDTLGMNLIYKDDVGRDKKFAIHNTTPERFQNMQDFETYMKRVFDVIYTLEAAEAEAMAKKGAYYIKSHYRQLSYSQSAEHRSDTVENFNKYLSNDKLNLDSFVDLGLVSSLIPSKDYGRDDYIEVNMFDAQFGIMENPDGVSGGLTFRRVAFELLAEKGYYGGMVPYISNQYAAEAFKETGKAASDSFIFKKIFGNDYENFKAFRKAMLNRRKDDAVHLKTVIIFNGNNPNYQVNSYQEIVRLLKQAMDTNNPYAVETMKRNIYRGFFQGTDEFRQSIYKDGQN